MAKILQVIDVDSEGHKVRLDDGRTVRIEHNAQPVVTGDEFIEMTGTVSDDGPELPAPIKTDPEIE